MQLILKFRHILPTMVVEEFDNIVATIRAFFGVEHKEDGTHGNLHADSITVAGNPIVNASGKLPNLGLTYVADARIDGSAYPSLILDDGGTSRTRIQQLAATAIGLQENAYIDANGVWNLENAALPGAVIMATNGAVYFYTIPAGANPRTPVALGYFGFDTAPVFVCQGPIRERGRTIPLGEWIDVPYSAANFSAATGTWTVPAGNILAYKYTLIGKTMILQFYANNTTISAVTASISLAIPGGFAAVADYVGQYMNYSPWQPGACWITGARTVVNLYLTPGFGAWAASTKNISLMIEIPLA